MSLRLEVRFVEDFEGLGSWLSLEVERNGRRIDADGIKLTDDQVSRIETEFSQVVGEALASHYAQLV